MESEMKSTNRKSKAMRVVEPREVLDIKQAAEFLGISTDSLYKYASEATVPAFRLGNRWKFQRSRLLTWMQEQSDGAMAGRKKPVSRAR
jgi:excisionase family DNA binding protein